LIEGKFGVDYCRLSENEELKVEKACFLLWWIRASIFHYSR